jgi:hypothetical protein
MIDKKLLNRMLIHVEDSLNRSYLVLKKDFIPDDKFKEAIKVHQSESKMEEFLNLKLIEKGYKKKSGKPDAARFYNTVALVSSSAWSDLIHRARSTTKEVLFRIVIGFKFNKTEADEFLRLAGCAFDPAEFRDNLIEICIQRGADDPNYYDRYYVYEIFEFYRKAGKVKENIYVELK